MTNIRGFVDYTDTDGSKLTFKIDGVTITYDGTKVNGADATMIGKAVTLSADGTVALAVDGDAILGKLERVAADDGDSAKCLVTCKGPVQLPGGASATLTRGLAIVGALGAASAKGYVRVAASGTAAELAKCRGIIIESGTATAVWIIL